VGVVRKTLDPTGAPVELTAERWAHIVDPLFGHPEMSRHQTDVMRAVREPDLRMSGRREGEVWYFLAEVGPSRWLQAVVAYERGVGRIGTAFARRELP